ncbi:DUF7683 domain-containing protein [Nocardia thailandica]|uniref:DUF7683 domain-containing protein n=1 Tax=Nocardia thailandica TaxID=257275 RepID=UPI0005B889FE|nr:hypothetical protein [Nocardia thailandica]
MTIDVELFDKETEKLVEEFDISHIGARVVAEILGITEEELAFSWPLSGDQRDALFRRAGISPSVEGCDVFVTAHSS